MGDLSRLERFHFACTAMLLNLGALCVVGGCCLYFALTLNAPAWYVLCWPFFAAGIVWFLLAVAVIVQVVKGVDDHKGLDQLSRNVADYTKPLLFAVDVMALCLLERMVTSPRNQSVFTVLLGLLVPAILIIDGQADRKRMQQYIWGAASVYFVALGPWPARFLGWFPRATDASIGVPAIMSSLLLLFSLLLIALGEYRRQTDKGLVFQRWGLDLSHEPYGDGAWPAGFNRVTVRPSYRQDKLKITPGSEVGGIVLEAQAKRLLSFPVLGIQDCVYYAQRFGPVIGKQDGVVQQASGAEALDDVAPAEPNGPPDATDLVLSIKRDDKGEPYKSGRAGFVAMVLGAVALLMLPASWWICAFLALVLGAAGIYFWLQVDNSPSSETGGAT